MPFLKHFASTLGQKPGNKFFATVILIGIALMLWIWLTEKHVPKSAPKPKSLTNAISQIAKTNHISVLVATKTNLPPVKLTNAVVASQTKTSAIAPVVPSRPNETPDKFSNVRPVQTVLEAQIALARLGISPGSIDGAIGSQTRAALRAFQQSKHLPVTGELDASTKANLFLAAPLYINFFVTTNDLARLQPLGTNWASKAQQTRLDYETLLEMVSEKVCCHPGFLKQLNPAVNWTNVVAPIILRVPNLEMPKPQTGAAFIRIRLSEKNLEAFDAGTNLLAHFPCSIAQRIEKRPVGELHVAVIAENPDYTFDPENFPESPEARRIKTKLILPPGPNNPVGAVWIGLDKPGYGIHGTPNPESVGRTESHGCFRLANWNAEYLLRLVSVGTRVLVEP